jgi:hypothetical protein
LKDRDGVDRTTEQVHGGMLRLVQIYPIGKPCIQEIIISCGATVTTRRTERSIVLNVATIRKGWFKKGNPGLKEKFV